MPGCLAHPPVDLARAGEHHAGRDIPVSGWMKFLCELWMRHVDARNARVSAATRTERAALAPGPVVRGFLKLVQLPAHLPVLLGVTAGEYIGRQNRAVSRWMPLQGERRVRLDNAVVAAERFQVRAVHTADPAVAERAGQSVRGNCNSMPVRADVLGSGRVSDSYLVMR